MNFNRIKGYVLVVIGGIVLLAGAILIVNNWGTDCKLTFYWKIVEGFSIGLLMVLSALAGIALWWAVRLLWQGVRSLRKDRDLRQAVEKAVSEKLP